MTFTRNDVYAATHEGKYFGWGYTGEITVNGVTYPIEWVENAHSGYDDESSGSLKAVFKVTDEHGTERYFGKTGYYASHYGSEWDGPFFEATPVEVAKTEYQEI